MSGKNICCQGIFFESLKVNLPFTYLSFLVKLETVSVPSSFFCFIWENHLSRKLSEQHGPLELDSDTRVPELGLPTNTDQNPEFQNPERTAPPSFTAEPQKVLVSEGSPTLPTTSLALQAPENHSCCSASAVKMRPSGALIYCCISLKRSV